MGSRSVLIEMIRGILGSFFLCPLVASRLLLTVDKGLLT